MAAVKSGAGLMVALLIVITLSMTIGHVPRRFYYYEAPRYESRMQCRARGHELLAQFQALRPGNVATKIELICRNVDSRET